MEFNPRESELVICGSLEKISGEEKVRASSIESTIRVARSCRLEFTELFCRLIGILLVLVEISEAEFLTELD